MPSNDDPFASFEVSNLEMTAWEREQTRKAVDFIHSRRNFDDVLRRVRQYRSEPQPPKQIEVRGRVIFSLEDRTASGAMSVQRRDGRSARTTLFQVGGDDASSRTLVDFMAVSPSGKLIAVGTSNAGTEETVVRVLDARTGKEIGERTSGILLGCLVWLPDDTGYLYTRDRGHKNVAVTEQVRDLSVALHMLGKSAEQDIEIVGSRAVGKRIHGDYDFPYPSISPNGHDVVVSVRHGVNPELTVFTKKREALQNGSVEWQRLYEERDRVISTATDNGRVVVVRNISDSDYALEEVALGKPERRILYSSRHPLESVISAGKDTFVVETEITTKRLIVVHGVGQVTPVALPTGSSVWPDNLRLDNSTNKLVIDLRFWTEPRSWWTVAEGRRVAEAIPEIAAGSKLDGYEVRSLEAPARDGERVPLTVIGPKGETSPKFVWVAAYGSYGSVYGPAFTVPRRTFFAYGGTYVFAHVRGGGEKGRTWHDQARGPNKVKSVEDLIDSLKFLRGQGFGTGGGIYLYGGSAGGIPVGGVLVREPGLVDVVGIEAGIVNVSRMEAASAIGAMHKDEFGTTDTPDGARRMREIDAYLNVRADRTYPPTLLIAPLNDFRVPRWQSSKFAARLQATAGTKEVFLRLLSGGHVGGNTPDEEAEMQAEFVTFALSHLKHPQFL